MKYWPILTFILFLFLFITLCFIREYCLCNTGYGLTCLYTARFEFWFERYQTLLTGFLAVFIGGKTISAMREQIKAQEFDNKRARYNTVAGKTLVLEQCIISYLNIYNNFISQGRIQDNEFVVADELYQQCKDEKIPKILKDFDFIAQIGRHDINIIETIVMRFEYIRTVFTSIDYKGQFPEGVNTIVIMSAIDSNGFEVFLTTYQIIRNEVVALLSDLTHHKTIDDAVV